MFYRFVSTAPAASFPVPVVLPRPSRNRRAAFTLIELLVVIGIIAVLAAILFPVFLTARGKAREISCLSNLREIGVSVSLYAQDYDGLYPFAIDPADKFTPQLWDHEPEFQTLILKNQVPMIHEALQPYVKSKAIFHCPADTGFDEEDFAPYDIDPFGNPKNAHPSSFEKFGTSYYYRTEIAVRHAGEASFQKPAEINLLFDRAGRWHGSFDLLDERRGQRYNTVFADGHAKNLTRALLDELWAAPL